MRPGLVILGLWIAFAFSWLAAALWRAETQASPGFWKELPYRLLNVGGGLLMAIPAHRYEGELRLWQVGWWGAWACVLGIALGFAFCWWARLHLGRLWSGNVTVKADHRVVDTGPYGLVRHPIYTGLLFSLLALAVVKGTILGVGGFVVFVVGFWVKARQEEQWLSSQLGAEAYEQYRKRVPMLIPFWPVGRAR